jgi:phosphate transport system protein
MLAEKIISLKKELMEFSSLVESMLEKAIKGLLGKDGVLLAEVIDKDEPKANNSEIELDELCTNLIAQFEPRAKDLRTILMVLTMSNDRERMGDHAVNISHAGQFLIDRPPVKSWIDMPRMAEVTIQMLKDSVTAFVNEDAGLAKVVCERDYIVDGLRNQLFRELITYMTSDPTTIERAFALIKVSSNLERIADLSTNICEDVIFMVAGRVIKHHREEEQASE